MLNVATSSGVSVGTPAAPSAGQSESTAGAGASAAAGARKRSHSCSSAGALMAKRRRRLASRSRVWPRSVHNEATAPGPRVSSSRKMKLAPTWYAPRCSGAWPSLGTPKYRAQSCTWAKDTCPWAAERRAEASAQARESSRLPVSRAAATCAAPSSRKRKGAVSLTPCERAWWHRCATSCTSTSSPAPGASSTRCSGALNALVWPSVRVITVSGSGRSSPHSACSRGHSGAHRGSGAPSASSTWARLAPGADGAGGLAQLPAPASSSKVTCVTKRAGMRATVAPVRGGLWRHAGRGPLSPGSRGRVPCQAKPARRYFFAFFFFGLCLSAAWAAASRATGTRKGEQLT